MSFSISNVLSSVLSSIPSTDAYALKVRKVDNPQKSFYNWPVVQESGLIKVYHDAKNKQFECVMYTNSADGHETSAYSLFKISKEPKAIEEFSFLCSALQPFQGLDCKNYSADALQRLCNKLREHKDWSPAHLAVSARFREVLRLPGVLKHVNSQQCELKRTPLHMAVQSNNNALVSELIACYARVDLQDTDKETVLHYAARVKDKALNMVKLIPMDQTDINCLNKYNQTAVNVACKADNFDVAEFLIKAGAVLDAGDDLGFPIHYAMKKQKLSMVQAIFDAHKDAGTTKCNKHGATPLHWAKTTTLLNVALKYTHEINATSKTGDTALHIMVKRLRMECAQILLVWGADPNVRGQGGETALHMAARHNNLDLVNTLIVFGADVNVKNFKGETPRHIASTQMVNTFQSFMGRSSSVIYALHQLGALRCSPDVHGCKDGCKPGGLYNGKPEDDDVSLKQTPCEKVYDDFLHLTVGMLATMGSPQGSSPDETDSGMEVDGQTGKVREKDTVLCLDGGGIRGLILIQLLDAIEKAAGRKIVDMFDWITGTSTGGILALAMVYGYSIIECRKIYFSLKNEVFVGSRPYKSENLERLMKDCFGENTTMDKLVGTKVFITGTMSDRSPAALHLFRNFDPPDGSSSKSAAYAPEYKPPPEPKDQLVWRAGRSSGAAPTYFPPMGRFLDGGLISNNPTLDTITEITEYYMDKKMKRDFKWTLNTDRSSNSSVAKQENWKAGVGRNGWQNTPPPTH
ncbi:putative 85/88 kDa calcium-independent phospholipase A2 [Apostichopus japonicus]|uniref:phospholipase A2 n=1 Tax=Stichopus japonicus TaxID=307972 RepID=A0A2G8KHH6_STIJA|nr:putative 85/88 kDa calcium-independent phospholipase A2 [Apostichopus japonicus]